MPWYLLTISYCISQWSWGWVGVSGGGVGDGVGRLGFGVGDGVDLVHVHLASRFTWHSAYA